MYKRTGALQCYYTLFRDSGNVLRLDRYHCLSGTPQGSISYPINSFRVPDTIVRRGVVTCLAGNFYAAREAVKQ